MAGEMITIDYSLKPAIVRRDRSSFRMRSIDDAALKHIAQGKIYVTDDKHRHYFIIESQIVDYASQLMGVVSEFDKGNLETFAVSPDFFSNNIRFTLDPKAREVEVYEVNGGSFCVKLGYKLFRNAVHGFYHELVADLPFYYPGIVGSAAYQRLVSL